MCEHPRLLLLAADDPADRALWLNAWQEWPAREVFAHPSYVQLFAGGTADRAMAALLVGDGGTILYPFIWRPLCHEAWYRENNHAPLSDIASPYGYSGAFAWGRVEHLAEEFWSSFGHWAKTSGVVSEFVRFALFPETLLHYPGEKRLRQMNVVRSLHLNSEELWMDFEHKVRKNVRKAERSGLRITVDLTGEYLDQFMAIYEGTMDRRSAPQTYYFPREFFSRICSELAGQFAFFHAWHGESVVSSELVLLSAENVYSFLGGTEDSSFVMRPNDLLKFEIIQWAQQAGYRRFVLGGGYAPGDGIFRYKAAFAPGGEVGFYTGERVFDAAAYNALLNQRRAWASRGEGGARPEKEGYFPAYRG